MTVSMMTQRIDAPGLALQDLMRRFAREMRIAASIADDCQDALGGSDQLLLTLDHETAARLQGLDLLSQQLSELGWVLDRLAADGLPGEAPPTLLDAVRLFDLKQRLAGADADASASPEPELW
jgi:hypothetical protein